MPYLYYGIGLADDVLSLGVGYSPTITVNEDPVAVGHEIEVSLGVDLGIPVSPSIGFIAAPEAEGGYGYLRAGWEHDFDPVALSAELGLGVSGYAGTPFDLQDVTVNVGVDWRVAGPFHINAAFSIQYGPRTNEWLPWGGLAVGLWP